MSELVRDTRASPERIQRCWAYKAQCRHAVLRITLSDENTDDRATSRLNRCTNTPAASFIAAITYRTSAAP